MKSNLYPVIGSLLTIFGIGIAGYSFLETLHTSFVNQNYLNSSLTLTLFAIFILVLLILIDLLRLSIQSRRDNNGYARKITAQFQIKTDSEEAAASVATALRNVAYVEDVNSAPLSSGVTLETIVTVVILTSHVISVASSILSWYRQFKNSSKPSNTVVVVNSKGERLELENATPEEISRILLD